MDIVTVLRLEFLTQNWGHSWVRKIIFWVVGVKMSKKQECTFGHFSHISKPYWPPKPIVHWASIILRKELHLFLLNKCPSPPWQSLLAPTPTQPPINSWHFILPLTSDHVLDLLVELPGLLVDNRPSTLSTISDDLGILVGHLVTLVDRQTSTRWKFENITSLHALPTQLT